MDYWFTARSLLRYLLKSKTKYYIHSPFVFQFINEVLNDKRSYYCYSEIEVLRMLLRQSAEEIELIDMGAGMSGQKNKKVAVSQIAKNSLKSKKYAQLLFRIVNYYNCKNILELGTSLGLTTLYLSSADTNSKVVTLEGNPASAKIAQENFQRHPARNIRLTEGNFNDTLPKVLAEFEKLDFVFFDGNHRKEPTLNYFTHCLSKVHNDSVFVFDDIYWSEEMGEAWNDIKSHPAVTLTIDLFQLGIVFFRKENSKEHFSLYF